MQIIIIIIFIITSSLPVSIVGGDTRALETDNLQLLAVPLGNPEIAISVYTFVRFDHSSCVTVPAFVRLQVPYVMVLHRLCDVVKP